MKKSQTFRTTAFAAVFLANIASAGIPEAYAGNPILEALNQQLIAEGFEIISIKTTFLRRLKIEAHAPGIDREIVLAPGTGAILRDEQEIVDVEIPEPNPNAEPDNGNGNGENEQNNFEPSPPGVDPGDGETEDEAADNQEPAQQDTPD